MQSRQLNRPRRPCQWTGLLVAAGALLCAGPAAARVLDRVVALVDGRVLSWSQLDFEARVMLIDRGGVQAATGPLDASTTPERAGAGHRPARGHRRGGQAERLPGGAGGDRPAAAQLRVALRERRRVPGFPEDRRRGPGGAGRGARPRDPDREVHRGARPAPRAGARERGPQGLGGGPGRTDLGAGAAGRSASGWSATGPTCSPGKRWRSSGGPSRCGSSPARSSWRPTSWGSERPDGEEAPGERGFEKNA